MSEHTETPKEEEALVSTRSEQLPLLEDAITPIVTQRMRVSDRPQHAARMQEGEDETGGVTRRMWPDGTSPDKLLDEKDVIAAGGESVVKYVKGRRGIRMVAKQAREHMGDLLNERSIAHEWELRELELRKSFRMALGEEEAKRIIVHQKPWAKPTEEGLHVRKFQRVVPQLHMPHFELRGGSAEIQPYAAGIAKGTEWGRQYQRVNEMLIMHKGTERFTVEDFAEIQASSPLHTLLVAAEDDPELHAHLCKLVRAMIFHSNRTGEIFDLVGKQNIIVFKDTAYSARFIDPLHPNAELIHAGKQAILNFTAGKPLNSWDIGVLFTLFNYARTINGLSLALGLPDRVDILPPELQKPEVNIDFQSFPRIVREEEARRDKAAGEERTAA